MFVWLILGPHDVKVRVKALGICGSDVHHFKVNIPPLFSLYLKLVHSDESTYQDNTPLYFSSAFECNLDRQTMRCASFIVKKPMVIGHECAGIIEEVGTEVKSLAVGDRVALEPGISCRKCSLCKDGHYNLCPQMKFFGSPPTNGSLANKAVSLYLHVKFRLTLTPICIGKIYFLKLV